jgi:hypothetical protein
MLFVKHLQEGVDRMPIMRMTSGLRKLALTTHVSVSVGWLGAVAAHLSLAISGLTTRESGMAGAAHRSMEVIGWAIIVTCSLAALLSGLVQSLGTEWGPLRDYWIVAKLSFTVPATAVLLLHIPSVSRMARLALDAALATGDTALVYKPWGRTGNAEASWAGRVSAL